MVDIVKHSKIQNKNYKIENLIKIDLGFFQYIFIVWMIHDGWKNDRLFWYIFNYLF